MENSQSGKGGVALSRLNPEEVMKITTIPTIQENYCKISERSEALLNSEAGVAVQCRKKTELKITPESSTRKKFSKTGEQSEISRNSTAGEAQRLTSTDETGGTGGSAHEETGKTSEYSLNSWMVWGRQQKEQSGEKQRDINHYELALNELSETSDHSQELPENTDVSKPDNRSDCSDVQKGAPKCTGINVSVPKFSWFKSMSQIIGLTAPWHQDKVEGSPVGANTASSSKTNIT